MRQYGIFRAVYESFRDALAEEGARTGLFMVREGGKAAAGRDFFERETAAYPASLRFMVCDLCQTEKDKSGERVIAEELDYEAPARFAMTLALRGEAASWPALLEAMGCAARFLKDNPSAAVADFGWHGGGPRVFLEPAIREPAAGGGSEPCLTLYYRTEAALNSEKGRPLRRVQKRDLRTLVKEGG